MFTKRIVRRHIHHHVNCRTVSVSREPRSLLFLSKEQRSLSNENTKINITTHMQFPVLFSLHMREVITWIMWTIPTALPT
jgi:hypothetical protein